jgi:hypothetical protein
MCLHCCAFHVTTEGGGKRAPALRTTCRADTKRIVNALYNQWLYVGFE